MMIHLRHIRHVRVKGTRAQSLRIQLRVIVGAESDIVANGRGEHPRVLRDIGDATARRQRAVHTVRLAEDRRKYRRLGII
jgi:hypothetical protein